MKFLTYRKFNRVQTSLLLSSLLISPMALANPVKNNPTLKLQRAEIKNLKSQISQIQQQNQQKINDLMARLSKLEKLTEQEEKNLKEKEKKAKKEKEAKKEEKAKKEKANNNKTEKTKVNLVKKDKKTTKDTTKTNKVKSVKKDSSTKTKAVKKEDKSAKSKKAVAKSTAKHNEKKIAKKNGKKVLGADEISVEQLDLAKLSAGAKIETTQKPIMAETIKPADLQIKTIVQNDDESEETRKPRILKVKKLNINNKKPDMSAQLAREEREKTGAELYLKALKAFSNKNTDVAIHKLKEYVNNYPNGKMIPKAKYWLGESYLQKEPADYATARYYFLEVVDKHEHHPQNNKQSKALYRLCQLSKINNYDDELKKYTDMLQEKYPTSKEAKLALDLLKK